MAAQNKFMVITGCSSGIGLATAVPLAKENNFKVLATMRNLQKRGDLEKAAGTTLNKSLFIGELDISEEDSIMKFVNDTYAEEGQIDIPVLRIMAAQKKVVVITGCSSGIGLATAVLLAKENNFKVLATMRNLQKRDALEEAAGTTLNKSLFIGELDISKEDSIMKFVDDTYQKEGQVDILINNAASGQLGAFETVSVKAMQDLFQTNVFGTCKLTQEVVKRMKKRESGHIVFISSIAAAFPLPFSDFYVGSKCAIEGIAGSMAPVLRHFNIFVTCVEPGPSKTEIVANAHKNNQSSLGESTGDESTDALWTNFSTSFGNGYWESTREIAEVIKECITDHNPPFRVQTSQDSKAQVRLILADHTGEKANALLAKMLEAK